MGTRADFYVGRGKGATWVGSIGWDGYPEGIPTDIRGAGSKEAFCAAVGAFFGGRDDVTLAGRGWPWPWDDSRTTDYAYAFDPEDGKVWASCFGHAWFDPLADRSEEEREANHDTPKEDFPDMTKAQNVRFDEGSGLIVLGPEGKRNIGGSE